VTEQINSNEQLPEQRKRQTIDIYCAGYCGYHDLIGGCAWIYYLDGVAQPAVYPSIQHGPAMGLNLPEYVALTDSLAQVVNQPLRFAEVVVYLSNEEVFNQITQKNGCPDEPTQPLYELALALIEKTKAKVILRPWEAMADVMVQARVAFANEQLSCLSEWGCA